MHPEPPFGPRLQSRAVGDVLVERILSGAYSAPSAGDLQAYKIVVVRDLRRRQQLAEAANHQDFVAQAPVVFVFLMNPERSRSKYGERGARLYTYQDTAIAAAYAQLAAHALGLGSVWVGAFDDRQVLEAVSAPDGLRAASLLPVGFAAETPAARAPQKLSRLVRLESFSDSEGEPWR